MYEILGKRLLNSHEIYQMEVHAPWISLSGKPGQFVIVIPHPNGERVPLTISDIVYQRQSVVLVFQVVGDTTRQLADMHVGDDLYTIVGPLGHPSELLALSPSPSRLLFVAGGVGIAPVFPQVKWAFRQGIPTDVIIGARSKDLLFYEDELRAVCHNLHIMTDDGSYGEQGLVTAKVDELCSKGVAYSHCVAIGPLPMMKFVSLTTKKYDLPTIVSLNCMMVDGTGMCGACRVRVGDEVKFCCVDGPEFDGHLVDFDEAARKLKTPDARRYRIATAESGHRCNLAPAVEAAVAEARQRQRPQEQDPAVRAANFDEVSFGLTEHQAILEAGRCLQCKKPRCVEACPVGIDIPRFIQNIREENFNQAYITITHDSALPAVCGRVCPQETQCEGSCVMGAKGEPIAIGALERFVADNHRAQSKPQSQCYPAGRKVAVIGSGPSGLTCAGDLAKHGYQVTVFEALHHAGGVLVYGIPEFRLPKQKVVEPEIENLQRLGVEIRTNVIIGKSITIDQLFSDMEYDAVYIASGAGLPKFMGVPGETLIGVISANELLTRTNLMHGYDERYDTPIYLGRKVVVVGGGNVAMDAARTALRLGSEVTVVYRRGEADMPARREEVHHAKEEGVQFLFQTAPVEVIGSDDGYVRALRCVKMELGEPDSNGRRKFSPIAGSDMNIEADTVVAALGTSPNPLIRTTTPGLECHPWGGIVADEDGRTSRPLIFAGGDAVSGAATVILAMGAGRKAARAIIAALEQ
ncbi:MAG: glutamate synthase (NADPH/NADH) small chain [bacterium P3]|nr:MAG: glutamate synthase (NADPH/NADH) small chain [bacterium P3]KWW42202.1 MAG: glutamate synthase (NADPH/NADH) small chain [bacterium F083]